MGAGLLSLNWTDRVPDIVRSAVPGAERDFGPCRVLHITGPRIEAAVSFYDWSPENATIEMGAYATGPGWVTRPVMRELGNYAFRRVGVQAVFWRTSERNKRVCSIAERMGLAITRLPRGRGRHEDEMICALYDDAWRQRYGF